MLKWRMHTKDAAYKRKRKIQETAEKNDFISVADAKRIAFELPDIEPEDGKRGWRWSDLRGGSGMRVAMIDSDDKTQQYPYLYICDPTIIIHKLTAGKTAFESTAGPEINVKMTDPKELRKETLNMEDRAYADYLIKGLTDAMSYLRDGRRKCMVWKKSNKKDVEIEGYPCWFHCWFTNRIVKNDGTVVDQLLAVCEYQDGHVERIKFDHIRFVEEWD